MKDKEYIITGIYYLFIVIITIVFCHIFSL